jgi:hypothetical protein
MVDADEAKSIAQRWLDQQSEAARWACLIAEVNEYPWGWMFFYQSKAFLATGHYSDMLAGNAPFFVTREDGIVHEPLAGTGVMPEEHARLFGERLAREKKRR